VPDDQDPKKPRRQRGEGGLYKRASDGLWVGAITLPTAGTGKRRRRKTVSSKTMKGAQKKLNDAKKKLAEHGDLETADLTLDRWLRYWLKTIVKPNVDPETYKRYRTNAENHIIPEIGKHRLERITTAHVRELHARFVRLDLSQSTASSAHRTLVTALNSAMAERGLGRNVAMLVDSPRIAEADPVALSMEEVRRFMGTAERYPRTASRWLAGFLIGTRQGETIGLRWSMIDRDNQMVDIAWQLSRLDYMHGCHKEDEPPTCGRKRKADCPSAELDIPPGYECKQLYGRLCLTRPKNSSHLIPMPPPLVLALQLRLEQVEKERAGYVSDHDLVWCRRDGEPIAHEDDYDEWVDWLGASDIEHVKLHAARHTTATLLRALGYSIDVIQMILGHSTVLMTQKYTEMDMRFAREALAGYGVALAIES